MPVKFVVYGFAHLKAASEKMLKRVQEDKERWAECMAGLLLVALSHEAHLNHVGHRLFECWNDYLDRLSPEGKLRLICEKAGVEVDFGKRPFQSFRDVFRFRNSLVHAKTEYLDFDAGKVEETKELPSTDWQKFCSKENLERVQEDLESLIDLLQKESGVEKLPSFLLSEAVEIKAKST